jgi:leucine dehydrogenase
MTEHTRETVEPGLFHSMAEHGVEQLVFWHEPSVGYKGVIAVHDTTLGPALGGTRFWDYPDERAAVVDVLRLARGMTYKAAITGLDLGGGKSVILADRRTRAPATDREAVFRAHGRAIDSLGGRYITAEDVGTSVEDMEWIRKETIHVTGLRGRSGDPSPLTAYGVYQGIKAAALYRYGSDDLEGRHVAVQGVGHVGHHLCRDLHGEGARLTVCDIDPERVERAVDEFAATPVDSDAIYSVDADILAPCALGAVLDDDTLAVLRCDIVAGGANNQLAEPRRHGLAIHRRGILYAPDYAINAGGVVSVFGELEGWTAERARAKAGEIYDTLLRIFETAERDGIPTVEAADRMAERRLAGASGGTAPRAPRGVT